MPPLVMRPWQIESMCRGKRWLPRSHAQIRPEWYQYGEVFRHMDDMLGPRDPRIDEPLPYDYVRSVLTDRDFPLRFFLSADDQYLRIARRAPDDMEIASLHAYEQFGGDVMEEAYEKGNARTDHVWSLPTGPMPTIVRRPLHRGGGSRLVYPDTPQPPELPWWVGLLTALWKNETVIAVVIVLLLVVVLALLLGYRASH